MIKTPHHIALVGFMGSGKSTVGKRLSQVLQYQLCDVDALIEAQKRCTVADIFSAEGETAFRQYEYQLLVDLLHREDPSVIVCGGGLPCVADAMDILNQHAITIYLQAPVEVLHARLQRARAQRPMLQGQADLKQYIETLLAQREPFYLQAQFTLHIADKTVLEIVQDITNLNIVRR